MLKYLRQTLGIIELQNQRTILNQDSKIILSDVIDFKISINSRYTRMKNSKKKITLEDLILKFKWDEEKFLLDHYFIAENRCHLT
jgi:hypothetical protein